MNSKFASKVLDNPFGELVFFEGFLSETATLPQAKGEGKVIVNLEGITRISSFGVVQLVKWFNSLAKAKSVVLRMCPPPIVRVLGMVGASLPKNIAIESFFVPFVHDPSSDTRTILFSVGTDFDQSGNILAPLSMQIEGKEYVLDSTPEIYFSFLKN